MSVGSGSPPAATAPEIVTQMTQRIVQLEQQVAQAKAQVVKKPPIPNPKSFTGESTGTTTGYTIDDWIDDVEKQLKHHNTYFTTDQAVIEFATTYLSGKASGWWKSSQEERRASGQQVTTWAQMKIAVRERFQPIEAATVARLNLDKMSQKGTVQSYTEYFYKQMQYIKDMSIADQLHRYMNGLKANIRAELIKQKPTTIHDAVIIANTTESWSNMSAATPKYTQRSYGGNYGGGSSSNGAAPMELSNVNQIIQQLNEDANGHSADQPAAASSSSSSSGSTPSYSQLLSIVQDLQKRQQSLSALFGSGNGGGSKNNRGGGGGGGKPTGDRPRVGGVTREDYERCRAEGLCINCKKTGHIARDCTSQNLKF